MLGKKDSNLIFNWNLSTKGVTFIPISAKSDKGILKIKKELTKLVDLGSLNTGDIIISNARHYNSLKEANESLTNALTALETGLPSDLLAIDIRAALHALGSITGQITTEDLLRNIFGKFCIGK